MKENPTSSTIITKHHSLNGNPTLTKDSNSVTLDILFTNDLPNGIYKYIFDLYFSTTMHIRIFLYGECVGVKYKANTIYEHWDRVLYSNNTQTNANGGFFHRGYGRRLTFSGEFRHFGDHILAMGVSYAMNSEGVYNRF